MGRRKDSLNSGTTLRSPQLTALAARCRRSVWWANPIASPLLYLKKQLPDGLWCWRLELSSPAVEDSNTPLLMLKTPTLLSWWRWRLELSWWYRDILYTNILYTWQSLYELSLYGTEFIRDKVYTGQSLYRDKVYTRTKFKRRQSLYGTKFIQWQILYGDKVYTNFFHTAYLN